MAIFDMPFAINGDRNENLPTDTQSDGSISRETGWTQEYAKKKNLGGKVIQRRDMNQILFECQQGVNTLEARFNQIASGILVVETLNSEMGILGVGTQIYCRENKCMYIVVENSDLIPTSTLNDAINLQAVDNLTPSNQICLNYTGNDTLSFMLPKPCSSFFVQKTANWGSSMNLNGTYSQTSKLKINELEVGSVQSIVTGYRSGGSGYAYYRSADNTKGTKIDLNAIYPTGTLITIEQTSSGATPTSGFFVIYF